MRYQLACVILQLDKQGVSAMKENTILKKMNAQQQVVGTFFETNGTSIVECVRIAGLVFYC